MNNQEKTTPTNYELLRSCKKEFFSELRIIEKSTGKTGVADISRNGVYVFYGASDGSDDKEISIEEFNTLFEADGTQSRVL